MKALVNYSFLVNPKESWENVQDFLNDFNEFLKTKNLYLQEIVTPDSRENIFEVCKHEEDKETPEPTVKQVKAKLTAKRDRQGKYLK